MTVTERAELLVHAGKADEFETVLAKAVDLLRAPNGCRAITLSRGVERPTVFLVLATWDSVEHHVTYRDGPAFQEFLRLIKPYLIGPSGMEHFTWVLER